MLTRGFYDSNDDGTGDLRGLTQRLDYLHWLGIDCLWLLPFYRSPLRDGGYDISDYFSILPEYGDLADAVTLIEEAHHRGIRVIADMVMNHTSDEHPWFIESRQNQTNPKADWYVWGDDDHQWSGGPDHLRRHREVELDLRPRPGASTTGTGSSVTSPTSTSTTPRSRRRCSTSSASGSTSDSTASGSTPCPTSTSGTAPTARTCKETHEYLKRLRTEVDSTHPGKVLLAEANQWPADVVDYFGEGDECHMCFHFPVMPRMFMAVRKEDRTPIVDILAADPVDPRGLASGASSSATTTSSTLEMVTDDERDYMYSEYAKDPRMKRNVGISRRLAPLVDNDRRLMELLHAMLLSFPGSPILYYGDEIGMGDNIYLGDRDGVRTPMQWTPDRNGGFSRSDFAQLYLPPLDGPGLRVRGDQRREPAAEHRRRSSTG